VGDGAGQYQPAVVPLIGAGIHLCSSSWHRRGREVGDVASPRRWPDHAPRTTRTLWQSQCTRSRAVRPAGSSLVRCGPGGRQRGPRPVVASAGGGPCSDSHDQGWPAQGQARAYSLV